MDFCDYIYACILIDSQAAPSVSLQELEAEFVEKEVVYSALMATGKSIMAELDAKACHESPANIRENLMEFESRWTALKTGILEAIETSLVAVEKFSKFLERFTAFLVWLSEFRGTVVDEACVQILTGASEERIAVRKHILQVRGVCEWWSGKCASGKCASGGV